MERTRHAHLFFNLRARLGSGRGIIALLIREPFVCRLIGALVFDLRYFEFDGVDYLSPRIRHSRISISDRDAAAPPCHALCSSFGSSFTTPAFGASSSIGFLRDGSKASGYYCFGLGLGYDCWRHWAKSGHLFGCRIHQRNRFKIINRDSMLENP